MSETTVTALGDRCYLIDAMMFDAPERLACYLYDTPRRVLVEVGPSRSLDHLIAALDEAGVDDVAEIVVTHIHLDHAGGVGHLAERFPNARIGVHRAGARHLIDPTRLWRSASQVYGEAGMDAMWGPMHPVAEDRIHALDEGDTIDLGGGRRLEVLATPGHAKHHVVFWDRDEGGMYVGDAVGVSFPHGHLVQPVTPPPDFDPYLVTRQLQRMSRLRPEWLGFAHFGPHREPQRALVEAQQRLWQWVAAADRLRRAEGDLTERFRQWALDELRREGWSDDVIATYDINTFWPMQPAGILHWMERTGLAASAGE